MILFKVFKASKLCTSMSVAVFCLMLTAFALQEVRSQTQAGEAEAIPAMAAVELSSVTPMQTPSMENLFYLPAPEVTPKTVETEQEELPDRSEHIRFDVITQEREEKIAPTARRVLIYHTHTWEAYEPTAEADYTPTERWRTKDEAHNVVRVGAELAKELEKRGFEVVHERQAFEPPVLSTAYTRSLQMLESYAQAGETFDY